MNAPSTEWCNGCWWGYFSYNYFGLSTIIGYRKTAAKRFIIFHDIGASNILVKQGPIPAPGSAAIIYWYLGNGRGPLIDWQKKYC